MSKKKQELPKQLLFFKLYALELQRQEHLTVSYVDVTHLFDGELVATVKVDDNRLFILRIFFSHVQLVAIKDPLTGDLFFQIASAYPW